MRIVPHGSSGASLWGKEDFYFQCIFLGGFLRRACRACDYSHVCLALRLSSVGVVFRSVFLLLRSPSSLCDLWHALKHHMTRHPHDMSHDTRVVFDANNWGQQFSPRFFLYNHQKHGHPMFIYDIFCTVIYILQTLQISSQHIFIHCFLLSV